MLVYEQKHHMSKYKTELMVISFTTKPNPGIKKMKTLFFNFVSQKTHNFCENLIEDVIST